MQRRCARTRSRASRNPPPTLILKAGASTDTSVSFTISTENADKVSYMVIPAGDNIPAPESLLADGTAGDLAAETEYTVEGLENETEYTIAAAAANQGGLSEVKTIRVTTGTTPGIVLAVEGEPSFLTASFSIGVSKSEKAAYLIVKGGEPIPSAEDILASGTEASVSGEPETVNLTGLEPGTEYAVVAAAENPSTRRTVEPLRFRTMEEPAYTETVECTFASGTYYGDMYNDKGTGEFFLMMTDVEFINDYAASAGTIIQLDTYSQLSEVKAGARPLSGIYRFVTPVPGEEEGTFVDACTEYSIGGLNSMWRETDHSGNLTDRGLLTDATLEYVVLEDGYEIVAYATYGNGNSVKFTYKGQCTFHNAVPSELENIDVTGYESGEAVYYGRKNTFGSDEFVVRLCDRAEDPTRSVVLNFYVPVCSDPTDPRIPEGTFTKGEWLSTEPWTWCVGESAMGGVHIYGSYVEEIIDEVPTLGYVRGGSFSVRANGDGALTFDLDLTMSDEGDYRGSNVRSFRGPASDEPVTRTIKGSFTGVIPIDNRYPIPPGDLSITADRVWKAIYVSTPSQGGGYNYRIELLDTEFASGEEFRPAAGTGNHVVLDLWGTASDDPSGPTLPEGRYYMDYSSMPGTCHGQYTYVEHFDRNGNLVPLNFWNATVDVVREGSGYRIDFSGEDNLNEKITCSYSGPITFTVQTSAPVYGGLAPLPISDITGHRKSPEKSSPPRPDAGTGKRLPLKRCITR